MISYSSLSLKYLIPKTDCFLKGVNQLSKLHSKRLFSSTYQNRALYNYNKNQHSTKIATMDQEESLNKVIVLNLVRHGETEMNKADIVQSRTPGDLTERGIKMAQSLGQLLKDEKFDAVFTSDLKRCHDTTLNILKHNEASPPEPVLKPILRERDYGDLEFKPNEEVRKLMRESGLANHVVPIPGAEPYEQVIKRNHLFFQEICEIADRASDSQNILAVSHGSWILSFLDYLDSHRHLYDLHDYVHEPPEKRPLKNTGRTMIHVGKLHTHHHNSNNNNKTKRPVKIIRVHCTQHLDGI